MAAPPSMRTRSCVRGTAGSSRYGNQARASPARSTSATSTHGETGLSQWSPGGRPDPLTGDRSAGAVRLRRGALAEIRLRTQRIGLMAVPLTREHADRGGDTLAERGNRLCGRVNAVGLDGTESQTDL